MTIECARGTLIKLLRYRAYIYIVCPSKKDSPETRTHQTGGIAIIFKLIRNLYKYYTTIYMYVSECLLCYMVCQPNSICNSMRGCGLGTFCHRNYGEIMLRAALCAVSLYISRRYIKAKPIVSGCVVWIIHYFVRRA